MVTLTVLALLLSIAVPSFTRLLAANRLQALSSELVAGLNLARSEAVRRAQPVTLRAEDADSYSKGWRVFPDGNGNGSATSATDDTDGKPLRQANASSGTPTIKRVTRSAAQPFSYSDATTATDRMYVVFTSRGAITASNPAFFRICDPANPTVHGRIVQVNAVGKISIDSVDATCP